LILNTYTQEVVKEMKDKWITRGKMGKERNKSRDGEAQV
jgi:hypothetical protein